MPLHTESLIAALRSRLEFSQEKLAAALKVSLPTIQRWEKGRNKPDPRAQRILADFLKARGAETRDLYELHFGAEEKLPLDAPKPRSAQRSKEAVESAGPPRAGMDIKEMEGLLWRAACSIRGEKDASKFKDYILPLVFIKRLSDVFDDEMARLAEEHGDPVTARELVAMDHSLVRFFIPQQARWPVVSGRETFAWPEDRRPRTFGEQVTLAVRAIAKANPVLQGVIDIRDFNETRNGEREIGDDALKRLVNILSDPRYRLGLNDVEPDFLGRAYEYLLRKFAEDSGQSAGEFFTPREVGWLMAKIIRPQQGEEIYDPCCGSGGLLIKCELEIARREGSVEKPLRLFGQEFTGESFAIARMNMVLHDMEGEIVRGNSMVSPKFLEDSRLRRFDAVVTNPMWNQKTFDEKTYDQDPFGRFATSGGFAPSSSADWAWLQHVLASLKDGGRAAVVLDTGAASRGSGNEGGNKERLIRRWFVEHNLVEAVIQLPENLFYNTPASGLIFVLNRRKSPERAGKTLFVNASAEFQKGRPKNFLPDAAIEKIAAAVAAGVDVEGFARSVPISELADFNLSPTRYVAPSKAAEHRDIQAILDELAGLDRESAKLDGELRGIFTALGYRWRDRSDDEPPSEAPAASDNGGRR